MSISGLEYYCGKCGKMSRFSPGAQSRNAEALCSCQFPPSFVNTSLSTTPMNAAPVYRSDQQTLDAIRAIVREELYRWEGSIRAIVQEELEAQHDAYFVQGHDKEVTK